MNNKKVFPPKYAAKLLLYFVIAKGMDTEKKYLFVKEMAEMV